MFVALKALKFIKDLTNNFQTMKKLILCVLTIFIIFGNHLPQKCIQATVDFLGQTQTICVSDSTALRILWGTPPNDISAFDCQFLDNELLYKISQQYSLDVATIYALNRLYEIPQNKKAQDKYLSVIDSIEKRMPLAKIEKLKSKYFLFVPGLAYKEAPSTGADLARQMTLFKLLGIKNKLIETGEYALVKQNAQIIADEIIRTSKERNDIVLVSVSKGSLETAIALGKLLGREQLKSVSAWVSVGGILRGSPVADQYLKAPKSWLARFGLWSKGLNYEVVRDISHQFRSEAFNSLNLPVHLRTIHFVGIPLTSQVHKRIKARYCSLQKNFGPNDGLTTITDALTMHGIVISELGLDHYFKDENIEIKTLALACLL